MLYLKDSQMGVDTIYPELLMVGVVCWNKLPGCWQLTDKTLLTINHYLLKHIVVTIKYIYIFVAFFCIWETDKLGIWLVKSFYLTQFFREWGFCETGFSCWRDLFSYSLVFDIRSLLSSNPKYIYFYCGFPWEQTFLIG